MFLFRIIFLLIIFSPLCGREEPLSIVIIGAGPAGLAAAIEANDAGANVIIVDKRESYERERFVFLLEPTLNFLNKWDVSVSELIIFDEDKKIGLTSIKKLETALYEKVKVIGIPKIIGEFKGIRDKTALLIQEDQIIELPFDLLVGADGTHSSVREFLEIPTKNYARSFGSFSIIPSLKSEHLDFILPFKHEALFINKIVVPIGTIFAIQGDELSKEIICSALKKLGWEEEAFAILSNQGKFIDDIEVELKQSTSFSNQKESVILLGDAVATASFLRGMGANCAINEAVLAGHLFRSELKETDFSNFDKIMREITDSLIEDSAFLFFD